MKIEQTAQDIYAKLVQARGQGFPCGGQGTCGKCKVRLLTEEAKPLSPQERSLLTEEEIQEGIRLACYLTGKEKVKVEWSEESSTEGGFPILTESRSLNFPHEPLVKGGLALLADIGTTTLAMQLIHVRSGRLLRSTTRLNPQHVYGLDVMSRISAVQQDEQVLIKMQEMILQTLEEMAWELVHNKQPHLMIVAGNAVMNHILLGYSPLPLGIYPNTLGFKDSQQLSFEAFGWPTWQGEVIVLGNLSAFVGGDVTAGFLAAMMDQEEERRTLLVDIGTNGEIILNNKGKLLATSCAAGPALEAMGLACGMLAETGAIEDVQLNEGEIKLQTIGQQAARGLCGSGVLAVISEYLKAGLLTERGRLSKESVQSFLNKVPRKELWVAPEQRIYISQRDVRQVQLAKAAILSGIQALLKAADIKAEEVEEVYIAGQFGSHLKEEHLLGVGLLPPAFRGKLTYLGNTSLAGAYRALMSRPSFEASGQLLSKVDVVNLSLIPRYERLFAEAGIFPKGAQ